MYGNQKRRHWRVLPILLLAALLWSLSAASGNKEMREAGAAALKAAVVRSALQCYVVEGVYPPGIAYLEEHYGLRVNKEDYYVVYDIFASNVPPEVRVLNRK